jgi:hypothetical protein
MPGSRDRLSGLASDRIMDADSGLVCSIEIGLSPGGGTGDRVSDFNNIAAVRVLR